MTHRIAVDELRLTQLWQGELLLVRRVRGASPEEEPFTLGWLARLVLRERRNLREVVAASVALSVLQILPPFLVMVAIDRVLTHQSMSTLALIGLILALTAGYETLLGYARREIVEVMSTRLDARLNLHVFSRLLALPIDFFERTPTGETTHRISQIFKIRDFLTGKLVSTFLDIFSLLVLDERHPCVDGAGRLGVGCSDHRRVLAGDPPGLGQDDSGRDEEGRGPGRNRARHAYRQGFGAGECPQA
jgi:ABC-type bacteriocin/lantibiotic exporter with double-glycine peptidase domain